MDIRQLSYFVAVAREGTVTAAANALHMSQPPLSTQIHLLEQELGCTLFDRSARKIRLTDAGHVLYDRACSILDLCTSVENEMLDLNSGFTGTLRLGVISSLCSTVFLKWLKKFCSGHEKMKFELYEANTYQLLDKVRSNQIEIAFVRTPFTAPDLFRISLKSEPLCALGHPVFFPDSGGAVQLSQLAGKPLLFYRRWERVLTDTFLEAGLRPRTFCISDDARTVVSMAESGFGIGVVPRSVIPSRFAVPVFSRTIDCEKLHSEICAVSRRNMYLSSAARQFLEQIRQDANP